MTSDEKIDKLVDQMSTLGRRVDALTESVELLSHMHQDNEKRFISYFATVSESLKTLTRLAESHENRINALENDKH